MNEATNIKINEATIIKINKATDTKINEATNIKMNDSSPHSKSAYKPKRGLSLSIEKKKIKVHHYP